MDAYRVGLVGAGNRGEILARSFAELDTFSISGVADPNPTSRGKLAERLRATEYDSVEEMLAGDRPDVVIIATPDFMHVDACVQSAQAGCHLYIEKPLATTVADARTIKAATEEAGVRVAVGYDNRWNPSFRAAKAAIQAGQIGTVVGQTARLNDAIWVPQEMLRWADRSSPAWFLMSHTLDLAMWLASTTPTSVTAKGTRGVCDALGVKTWDAIYAHVEMADGSLVALNSAWILPNSMPQAFDFNYELLGSSGLLRLNLSENGPRLFADSSTSLSTAYADLGDRVTGIAVEVARDFAQLLAGEAVDMPGLQDGLLVTATIEAVHRSLQSGATEHIDA